MLLVNFSGQPISAEILGRLLDLIGEPFEEVREVAVPANRPVGGFEEEIVQLVDAIWYTPEQLQTYAVVVVPPEASDIACGMISELHGRIGHFPALLRLNAAPLEVVNLQLLRSQALNRRYLVP